MLGASSLLCPKNEGQWSINNFWGCILENRRAWQRQYSIIVILAAFLGNNAWDNITTMFQQWASMECQQLLALDIQQSKGCAATLTHNRTTGHLASQKCLRQHRNYVLNLGVGGVPMERQQSLNDFWAWNLQNPRAVHWDTPIINI